MSTTDHEGPEMSNGPYTGMSVKDLEEALARSREYLAAERRQRNRIKAELVIARAREASEPKPIPENPGWGAFAFNARFTGGDRVYPFVASQYDGKISVVAGERYWFFEGWDQFIEWLRDPEVIKDVSKLWKLINAASGRMVTVR